MVRIKRLMRKIEVHMPKTILIYLINLENKLRKSGSYLTYNRESQMYLIRDKDYSLFFPRKARVSLYTHGLSARLRYLYDAYGFNQIDFTGVKLFIDCGANVGELSIIVKHKHDLRILAVEPEKKEFECLERNLKGSNCDLVNGLLWDEEGVLQVYSKPNSGDSSVFMSETSLPDFKTNSYRLDNLVKIIGIKSLVSILKVEAEGAEPEVITGTKEYLPNCKYVTFDGGPERGMEKLTTFALNGEILAKNNFEKVYTFDIRKIELWKNKSY